MDDKQPKKVMKAEGPSPAAGLLFLVGGFGFLYSLIAVVDPMI